MSEVGWSSVAPAWEAHADDIEATSGAATDALLTAAAVRPGEDVLELAAGTGHLAVRLAELAGPGGSVLATDGAPAMVELAANRLESLGNASAATVDATSIPSAAMSYDVVVCQMGLMFVPEPVEALREIRRVLRPSGRLAAAVWGDMRANPWMASVGLAAMLNGLLSGPPPSEPGGPFSLGDPDTLEKLAREAGFGTVEVQVVDSVRHYASSTEQVETVRVLAPPIAAALEGATDEQLAAVRKSAGEYVAQYRADDGGLDLPSRALVLLAWES
jgi:SAM-dependent methyltransferase